MSYGIKKSPALRRGNGRTRVYAASGINPGHIGRWHSRPITPNGETLVPVTNEIVANRNYSIPIGGGPIEVYHQPMYGSITRQVGMGSYDSQAIPSWALGITDALTHNDNVPVIDEPEEPPNVNMAHSMSDEELVDTLNKLIAEGWRLKSCSGPYCMVQSRRNYDQRKTLVEEYRERQQQREMPALEEPIHTLSYGRYKLAKSIINWSDKNLQSSILWPVKIYVKAGAYAMEDILGGKYLTMLILASPLLGIWFVRKYGKNLPLDVFGGYTGMALGALLPLALYSAAKFIGEKEEKDFLWITG
jgi:hypothetical protein